ADPRQGLNLFVKPMVSTDPATWYSKRTQGGTDYGLRVTQLFGSQALATIQSSYHRDRNRLTAADSIQYTDLTCVGGTRERPCDFPPEPGAIWGGYGNL